MQIVFRKSVFKIVLEILLFTQFDNISIFVAVLVYFFVMISRKNQYFGEGIGVGVS